MIDTSLVLCSGLHYSVPTMVRMNMARLAAAAGFGASLWLAAASAAPQSRPVPLLASVDHLVYATPDLDATINDIDRLLGVHANAGGQHLGRGTRNALIALGATSYLEIIGPDPAQATPALPRPFGIDTLQHARLAAWGAKTNDVAERVRNAARGGVTLGAPTPGSRRRPDGVELTWLYTDPRVVVGDGMVPFFIDWGRSPHPARTAAPGASLIGLRAEHPRPDAIQKMLDALNIDLHVTQASEPALVATVAGRRGQVELR